MQGTDAYQVLVERHDRTLFRVAYRITRNDGDSEDVVQESFLRAYQSLDCFDERASFGTWMHRIASNRSLDLVRRRKRMANVGGELPEAVDPKPRPDRLLESSRLRETLDRGMKTLSEQEREAFVMRHVEGRSIPAISAPLAIGTRTKILLDGPKTLRMLFRVESGKVDKILLASEDCEIDAGSQTVTMLKSVSAAASIGYLAAREEDSGMYAISLHRDGLATEKLIEMARDDKNAKRQKKAFFWLARSKDPKADEFIARMLR